MNTAETGKIKFHFLIDPFHFKDRTMVKVFLINLFRKKRRRVDAVNYIFCTDEYLLNVNKEYLNHDTYTDIITFELSEKGQPLLSDIYISIDRIRENAKLFNVSFKQELHRVMFHGALHLCGYNDKSVNEMTAMKDQENRCLSEFFVSREIGLKD
jgi:probable rRNA maturation factor